MFYLFCAGNLIAHNVLYENFNTYNGTSNSVPLNWFFSHNGAYTSSTSAGPSGPNSFKFSTNNSYIISPMVGSGDSVTFYMKLNGTGNLANDTLSAISVLGSPTDTNENSFALLAEYTKISNTMRRYTVARDQNIFIKIQYSKVGGNVAIDDFAIFTDDFVGKNTIDKTIDFKIFPNPSNVGYINIQANPGIKLQNITITDVLGKELPINVSNNKENQFSISTKQWEKGNYIVKYITENAIEVKKIRIE